MARFVARRILTVGAAVLLGLVTTADSNAAQAATPHAGQTRVVAVTLPTTTQVWFGPAPQGAQAALSSAAMPHRPLRPVVESSPFAQDAPHAASVVRYDGVWLGLVFMGLSALGVGGAAALRYGYRRLRRRAQRGRPASRLRICVQRCDAALLQLNEVLNEHFPGGVLVVRLWAWWVEAALLIAPVQTLRVLRKGLRFSSLRARLISLCGHCMQFPAAFYRASAGRRRQWLARGVHLVGVWSAIVVLVFPLGLPTTLPAADYYFDPDANATGNSDVTGAGLGGSGVWNTSLENWWNLSGDDLWPNDATAHALFSGNSGTVTLGDTLTANALTFKTPDYLLTGGTLLFAGATPTITVNGNVGATIGSVLDGATDLTKAGAGTLYLSGTNTYTGRTILNGGTLSIIDDGNLGTAPGSPTADAITFAAASTLEVTGTTVTLNANRGITLNTDVAGTLRTAAGSTVTYGGLITGAAGTTFRKTGSGTLDLQANNTATLLGALAIDGGTLKLSGAGQLAGTSGVTIGNRGTFTLDNTGTNLGDRTAGTIVSNGGTINFLGNAAATAETLGALTLNPGALTINSTPGAGGNMLTIPSITRNAGGTLLLSGTGIGTGTNQVKVTVAGTTSGSVLRWALLSDGTGAGTGLAVYNGDGAALTRLTTYNTGAPTTWVAGQNARPAASASIGVAIVARTLTLDNGINLTAIQLNPNIDPPLTMSEAGGGVIVQTGGSSAITNTTGNGFRINFGSNEALFHILGTLTVNGDTNSSGTTTGGSNLQGSGGFTKSGPGTLILGTSTTNAISGTYRLNEGTLELRKLDNLGNSTLFPSLQTLHLNGGTLRISGDTAIGVTVNALVNADTLIEVDRLTANATVTEQRLSGTMTIGDNRTLRVASRDVTAGTAYGLIINSLALTGAVQFDVANNGSGLGALRLVALTNTGGHQITKSGDGALLTINPVAFGGSVHIQGGRVGWDFGGATLTESGVFSGAGGLAKYGDGTVVLTGSNTFTGGVEIYGGTLVLGSAEALNAGTPNYVTFGAAAPATLQLNGHSLAVKGLSTLGAIAPIVENASPTSVTLTLGTDDDYVFAGTLRDGLGGGALSLVKIGSGSQTIGESYSYSGSTTVAAGTLNLTGSGTLVGSLSVAGGATLNLQNGLALAMNLSSISLGGTGTTTLGLDLGAGGSGDSLTSNSFTTAGTIRLDLAGASGFGPGTYTLLSAPNGGLSNAVYLIGSSQGLGTATGHTFTSYLDDNLVQVTAAATAAGDLYWTNAQGTNRWSTLADNTFLGNWSTDSDGLNPLAGTPGAANTVIFNSAAAVTGDPTTLTATIDAPFSIRNLVFNSTGAPTLTSMLLDGSGSLLLTPATSSAGIDVESGAPAAITISVPIALGADQTWTVADAATVLTLSGGLSGSAGLTKAGAGTVVLEGASTRSGPTSITGGTLRISDAAHLGPDSAGNSLTLSGGGTLDSTGATVVLGANRPIELGIGGGSIFVGGVTTNRLTVNAEISGEGGLTKSGAGELELTAANTFSGGFTHSAGSRLVINHSQALGTGPVTIGGGWLLTSTGAALTLTTNNPITLTNNFTFSGPNSLNLGTGNFNLGNATRTITVSAATLTIGGNISGTNGAGLTASAPSGATLVLSGNNTFTGGVTHSNTGVLRLLSSTALGTGLFTVGNTNVVELGEGVSIGNTMNITTGGATKTMRLVSTVTGASTYAGGVTNGEILAFAFSSTTNPETNAPYNATAVLTVSGVISGGGAISKSGPGTVLLSGGSNNTYTGLTTISGGTLAVAKNQALGSTAATTVAAGATLDFRSVNYTTAEPVTVTGGSAIPGISASTGSSSFAGPVTLATAAVTIDVGGTQLTLNGVVSGAGIGLIKTGTGALRLNNNNTFSGGVTLNGGTLILGHLGSLNSTTPNAVTFGAASSAVLQLNGNSVTTAGLAGTAAGTVENGSATNATLTLQTASDFTFAGTLQDGAGGGLLSLVKTGAGEQTFTGPYGYGGSTTVNEGALNLAGSASAPLVGNLIVAGGAAFRLHNAAGQSLSLPLISLGTAAMTTSIGLDVGTNSDTLSSNNFTVAGTIRLELAAVSGFGVGDYSLLSAASGLSGATYQFVVPGGYTYDRTLTDTDVILHVLAATTDPTLYWQGGLGDGKWSSFNGSVGNWSSDAAGASPTASTPGAGTTVVFSSTTGAGSGTSLVTALDGAFTINELVFNNTLGSGPLTSVTINRGTFGGLTLAPAAATDGIDVQAGAPAAVTIAAPITLGANQTWTVADAAATLTVSGALAGSASLTKAGAGALVLGAASSRSGPTTILAGTLRFADAAYLGDGSATNHLTLAGGTLESTAAAVTLGANRTLALGSGGGTIIVSGGAANTLLLNATISGAGGLVKDGAGILGLTVANPAFSGGITLAAGRLNVDQAQALGTGELRILGGTLGTSAAALLTLTTNNALTIDGNFTLTAAAASGLDFGSGPVSLGTTAGAARTIALTGGLLRLGGAISNGTEATGLNLTASNAAGTATYALGGNSTFTGGVTLSQSGAGTLVVRAENNLALGTDGSITLNSNNVRLELADGVNIGRTLAVSATGTAARYLQLQTGASAAEYSGNIVLSNTANNTFVIHVPGGGSELNLSGSISYATPATTTPSGGFIKTGPGTLILSGPNTYQGNTTVSGGTLNITNTYTGGTTTSILAYGGSAARTVVNVNSPGLVRFTAMTGANIAGAVAIYNQSGGTVTLQAPGNATQYVSNAGGYGFFNLTGGAFNVNGASARFTLSMGPSTGVAYIANATLNNTGANAEYMLLAHNGVGALGQMTVAAGGSVFHDNATQPLAVVWSSSTVVADNAHGTLNLAGGTVSNVGHYLAFNSSNNGSGVSGFVNLAGGTLTTQGVRVQLSSGGVNNNAYVNFAGATFKASTNHNYATFSVTSGEGFRLTSTMFGAIDNSAVTGAPSFNGGAVFDTNNFTYNVNSPLRGAQGTYGVTQANIVIPSLGNSGYLGAPAVVFGTAEVVPGGTPASGYALFDPVAGTVTGIVITNPGTYAAGAKPTITLTGGGGSIAAFSTTTLGTANTAAGLTKLGLGTLILSAVNTYSGGNTVGTADGSDAGTLQTIVNGALGVPAPMTVYGGTLDVDTTNQTITALNLGGGAAGSTAQVLVGTGGVLNLGGNVTYDAANDPNAALISGAGTLNLNGTHTFQIGSSAAGSGALLPVPDLVVSTAVADGTGTGGISKTGSGWLRLNGTGSSYTGPLAVTGGVLELQKFSSAAVAASVGSAATLFVNQPGQTLQLTTLDLANDATLRFGLGATATAATPAVHVAGAFTFGSTIKIELVANGFDVGFTPVTYKLLSSAAGNLAGTANAQFQLIGGIGGYQFTLHDNANELLLDAFESSGTLFWKGGFNGGDVYWSSLAPTAAVPSNWTSDVDGTATIAAIPGLNNDVYFAASGALNAGASIVDYGAAVQSLVVADPNTTVIRGADTTLAFGSGGLHLENDGAGLTLGSATVGERLDLRLPGSVVFTNANVSGATGRLVVRNEVYAATAGARTLTLAGDGDFEFSGLISDGAGTLTLEKAGSGLLTLGATNTFTGGARIAVGSVRLAAHNGLSTGALTLGSLGQDVDIDLNGFNQSFSSFALGSGAVGAFQQIINSSTTSDSVLTLSTVGTTTIEVPILDGTVPSGKKIGLVLNGSSTPRFILDAANTFTGNTTIGTGVTLQFGTGGSNPAVTDGLAITGTGSLVYNSTTARTFNLTLSGAGSVTVDGGAALTIIGTNSYTGGTSVGLGGGTLIAGGPGAFSPGSILSIGNAASITPGHIDLNGTNQSASGLFVNVNHATVASTITIDAGNTLTVAGTGNFVLLGSDGGVAGTTRSNTLLNFIGGGHLQVNGSDTNVVRVGGAVTANKANAAIVDLSGLASATFNLGTSGSLLIGDGASSANTLVAASSLTLAATTTITAGTLGVGDTMQTSATNTLKLGATATFVNANTVAIGQTSSNRSSGEIRFAGDTGTLKIRAANGTGPAVLTMVNTTAGTAAHIDAGFFTAGHEADLLFSTMTLGTRTGTTGNVTVNFTFDTGTLTGTTVNMATRGGTGNTVGTVNATMSLGGGTVNFTSITMATNSNTSTSAPSGAATGMLNISGGTVTLSGGITLASTTATGSAAKVANGTINLTGGALTVGGNIVNAGGVGIENTTLTINGGTLDMGGFSLGTSAANPVGSGSGALNLNKGTLRNVLQINTGAPALTALVSDGESFTITGTNGFDNALTVGNGTLTGILIAGSNTGLGSTVGGTVVAANAALRLANGVAIEAEALTLNGDGGSGLGVGLGALHVAAGHAASYAGAITLNTDARIGAGAGGTLTLTGGILADDRTVTFGGAGTIRIETVGISGPSAGTSIVAVDGATLILAVDSSYQGPTSILNGGTLQIGDGPGTAGSISSTWTAVTNNGTLAFNRTDDYGGPINNIIDGTGRVEVRSGVVSLANTSSYSGPTTVFDGGTLRINGSGWLTDTDVTVLAGGTLGGNGAIDQAVVVQSGGKLSPGFADDDVGTLTVGTLTLADGAILDFHFGTGNDLLHVLDSGGLSIYDAGFNLYQDGGTTPFTTLGTYDLIQYTGTLGGDGVSQLSVLNPDANRTYFFTLDSTTIKLTIAAGGANYWAPVNTGPRTGTWSSSAAFWAENDADLGTAQQASTGALIFAGTAGTVTVDGTVATGFGLTFASTGYLLTGGQINLTGSTANNLITVNTGLSAEIASALNVSNGLTKAGDGTLVLSGTNTLANLVVNGGTLNTTAAGALAASAAVSLASGTTVSLVAGTPALGTVTASGTLQLAGTAAEIAVLNGAATGSVHLASGQTLTVGQGNYAGALVGDATTNLVKSTAGLLVLNGNVTGFLGNTTINAGELSVANPLGGTITINSGGTFSGLGAVGDNIIVNPGGTLVSSSTNNGDVDIDGGDTNVGAGGELSGTINVSSGSLNISAGGTVSGNLIQTGGLTTVGADGAVTGGAAVHGGTFTVDPNGSVGGGVTVGNNTASALAVVNGSVSGSVTVGQQGTVGGGGEIGAIVVQSGGTLAPGNSPGTLEITGNGTVDDNAYLQLNAGARIIFEFNNADGPAGTAWDLVDLADDGTLNINFAGDGAGNRVLLDIVSLASSNDLPGRADDFDIINPASYRWLFIQADNLSGATAAALNADGGRNYFLINDDGVFLNDDPFARPLGPDGPAQFGVAWLTTADGVAQSGLYVTFASVPEPGSMILTGLGSLAAAWYGRRRKTARAAAAAAATESESAQA